MFTFKNELFESKENELIFENVCGKLINHPFESPWKIGITPANNEVYEFYMTELDDFMDMSCAKAEGISSESFTPNSGIDLKQISSSMPESCEVKISILKKSLISVQDPLAVDEIKGMEILSSISLSEFPQLCDVLKSSLSNEVTLVLFLNAVLKINKPLRLSIAAALVNQITYPLVFESKLNNSRNLLASVLNFSEIYPIVVIDEIFIPCLKKDNIENLHFETLMKIARCNLPKESVSYCIKTILELPLPSDNTFSILQIIIERKIHLEKNIQDTIAWTLEAWSGSQSKSVKFTKLIISILTIYGSELTDNFTTYYDIIGRNETIMKKAAENVLKKLKKS